jgi:hypothetical protein
LGRINLVDEYFLESEKYFRKEETGKENARNLKFWHDSCGG